MDSRKVKKSIYMKAAGEIFLKRGHRSTKTDRDIDETCEQ